MRVSLRRISPLFPVLKASAWKITRMEGHLVGWAHTAHGSELLDRLVVQAFQLVELRREWSAQRTRSFLLSALGSPLPSG